MALPPEYLTPKMEATRKRLAALPLAELIALPALTREDNEMIGTFIQHFNFIDLNLRRAIEIFLSANLLPASAAKKYENANDAGLADIVKTVFEKMDPMIEDIGHGVEVLNAITHVRTYRNLMGHCAGKLFPGEDVIVFAGSRQRDAKKTIGRELKRFHIQIFVAGRSELRNITLNMSMLSDWVAQRIPVWHSRYIPD